jgi:cytoskeletal protein RodZ
MSFLAGEGQGPARQIYSRVAKDIEKALIKAGMTTVAEQLHVAREAQKLTINQVAEVTKIRTDHIRALEEGNFNVFSAPVYIRGFVRSYATMLKLDVTRVMANLDGELGKTEKFREPPPLSEQKRGVLDFLTLQLSKVNWRIASVVIFAAVVIVVIGSIVTVMRHRRTADPLANLPTGVYQPSSGGETAPIPATKPK